MLGSPSTVCWASYANELRRVMEFGSGRSSDSEPSHRGIDLRRLTRVSKLETVVLKLPTFRRESAESSPVNSARNPEVCDGSRIDVSLSCEEFGEHECNPSTIAVPLSCEDSDEDAWEYEDE
jgi:hypothetical protein